MDTQTFHIKIIFEVIKTFLNSILVPVHLKSFCRILNAITYKHEPTDMVLFMLANSFLIVIYPDASYRCFMDQEELIIIRGMLFYMPAGYEFFITSVQGMVKIPFVCRRLETIVVDVDVEPMPFPLGRFRDRIQSIPKDCTVIMMGTDAVSVAFHCLAGKTDSKRYSNQELFMAGIHCVKV